MQHNNTYIFIYSAVMVVVVATLLAFAAESLRPAQEKNVRLERMQNILSSVNITVAPEEAEAAYKKYITEEVVLDSKGEKKGDNAFNVDLAVEVKKTVDAQQFPMFICKKDDGSTNYIIPVRGNGLWGPIWGFIAVGTDGNTIVGSSFGHKGETPGLGAEISEKAFQDQFVNKKLLDESGNYVSVKVVKGGAPDGDLHGVDAISGGTITSNGVSEMLQRSLGYYVNYLKSRTNTQQPS